MCNVWKYMVRFVQSVIEPLVWVNLLVVLIQGWRASVKSPHFVLALRDYYQDSARVIAPVGLVAQLSGSPISIESTNTLSQPHRQEAGVFAITRHSAIAADIVQSIPHATIITEDEWTLQYIRVDRLRHILDAIDTDVSGFITVNEVNTFTKSRPRDWR